MMALEQEQKLTGPALGQTLALLLLCVTGRGPTRDFRELLAGAECLQDTGVTQCRTWTILVLLLPPPREADEK